MGTHPIFESDFDCLTAMSDRDVLDMDLEENEEKELLDDGGDDRHEIEESIEAEIQEALNGNDGDDDQVDRESDDDEMEKLRREALNSKKKKKRKDSCGTPDSEDDDALTAMRRELLAQRAQKKPNHLRARLGQRRQQQKQVSAFINPHVTPKKPVTVSRMQFPNFEVKRTVDNKVDAAVPSKKREIVSETKSKFKITRTVKNEVSGGGGITDKNQSVAYSDAEDEIEVNLKHTASKKSKKSKTSRAVFENASEMNELESDESLDDITSDSESSESDDNKAQMFVLKAGDKRGVVKKVKSPSKSKKSKSKESPKPRQSRTVKDKSTTGRSKSPASSSSKSKRKSEKEDELEKKMERIRRDNEKREKRARLVEREKRKYSGSKRR